MIAEAAVIAMTAALPTHDWRGDNAYAVAVEVAAVSETVDEAATLLVTAYAETRFRSIEGDHHQAFGVFQLHNVTHDVGFDLKQATPIALERLRLSIRSCKRFPLAPYIGGCRVPAAQRASAYRMAIVARMTRRLPQSLLHVRLENVNETRVAHLSRRLRRGAVWDDQCDRLNRQRRRWDWDQNRNRRCG